MRDGNDRQGRLSLASVLEVAPLTDTGRKRSRNEDSLSADAELGLLVVADGMGGHSAGDVASAIAIQQIGEQVRSELEETPAGGIDETSSRSLESLALEAAIERANGAIHRAAADQPHYADMGTTVVAALFHNDRVTVGHVGDSRLYRMRDGRLERLTVDHSVVQELLEKGFYASPEEAARSGIKNMITRALGPEERVTATIQEHPALPGDLYLLCSDGLSDMVADKEIHLTLSEFSANLKLAAEQLVRQANENGGRDNISVILARTTRSFPAHRSWYKRVIDWFI